MALRCPDSAECHYCTDILGNYRIEFADFDNRKALGHLEDIIAWRREKTIDRSVDKCGGHDVVLGISVSTRSPIDDSCWIHVSRIRRHKSGQYNATKSKLPVAWTSMDVPFARADHMGRWWQPCFLCHQHLSPAILSKDRQKAEGYGVRVLSRRWNIN